MAAVASVTDFAQFAELRRGADANDPEALREVAGQFEALFVQSMLKSMREASMGDPFFGNGNDHEMYQEMLDKQLALEMAKGKGIGLAEMLVRQLGDDDAARRSNMTLDDYRGNAPAVGPARETATDEPRAWRTPESFARDAWPHAQRVAKQLDVSPEAVLAQAALETGWGRHVMPAKDGSNSHNLFGIKAGEGWSGDRAIRRTIEFENGVARHERATFRAYGSVAASFDDYFELLSGNPRYAGVKGHGENIDAFAGALANSGYATDPAYAEKISRVASSSTMSRVMSALKNSTPAPIEP